MSIAEEVVSKETASNKQGSMRKTKKGSASLKEYFLFTIENRSYFAVSEILIEIPDIELPLYISALTKTT